MTRAARDQARLDAERAPLARGGRGGSGPAAALGPPAPTAGGLAGGTPPAGLQPPRDAARLRPPGAPPRAGGLAQRAPPPPHRRSPRNRLRRRRGSDPLRGQQP